MDNFLKNNYVHPPLSKLVEIFSPELEGILKNKLVEQFETILFIKKQNRKEKEDSKISFQKK